MMQRPVSNPPVTGMICKQIQGPDVPDITRH